MQHTKLTAEVRTVEGKQVKQLRREGILPAHLYGKDLKSMALQVKTADFLATYHAVGHQGIIDIQIDGKIYPVLVKQLQMDYRTHTPLHADLFKVNLKEKIKAMIAVVTVGEPQAVVDKQGLLLQTLSEVEVEALPEKLPEQLEVNVAHLAAVDEHVTASDIQLPEGVTLLTDPTQTVAKIAAPQKEEPVEEVSETTAEEGAPTEEPVEETPPAI